MSADSNLEYRSAVPEARRAKSPYARWLLLVSIAALLWELLPSAGHQQSLATVVAAIILFAMSIATIIDIERTKRKGKLSLAIGFGMSLLLGAVGIASMSEPHPRDRAYMAQCISNLHNIGLAGASYAQEHGHWPDTLEDLVSTIGTSPLSCPLDHSGGRYFYIPPKENPASGTPFVIAFELPQHFRGQMNVLMSDGATETYQGEFALRLLAELATGQNPPPSLRLNPATQPSTNPR